MKFKYGIVSIYLITSLLAINCSTVSKLSKEQIETFQHAKTVRITVEQSYGIAKDVSLPFEDLAQRLLEYAGVKVVARMRRAMMPRLGYKQKEHPSAPNTTWATSILELS